MLTIQERVAAGIAFINEKFPNRLKDIDIEKLDVRNTNLCVIGQLFGRFDEIDNLLDCPIETAWKYGFDANGRAPSVSSEFNQLTTEWKRQLTELQSRIAQQQMNEDEWAEKFKPVPNHIDPFSGWTFGGEQGCLFETYGQEFEFVKTQDPSKVWTLVDGDEGGQFIVSGLHYVNRIGYFVTANPAPNDCDIEVAIEGID